ncbi:MAG TPA: FAD-linked oxidase C-terminal domain-containing protein, partial [Candidatus Sumerlaeota bacterium]|nr:FAD-linked oxidase C-terminal domain-containing protein [Candidatus Sumerlaeota bacterium]
CYSYDATIEEAMPDAVCFPGTAQEIADIMKIANEYAMPVIPRGSGTGLSGGSLPVRGGLILSICRLNRILEINTRDYYAVVESGVITQKIIEEVAKLGLMYPPDPSSMKTSTIGGNVAENAGGLRGLKYGVTKDYVMGMEVVTPAGDILHTGTRTVKTATGYNLSQLYTGSEGTLGIITTITLKLIPAVEHKESVLAIFDDMNQAAQSVADIIAAGILPATLEFLDNITINAVEDYKKIGLPRDAGAILLIETDGVREAAEKEIGRVQEICAKNNARSVQKARTEEERENIWQARRAALSALARVRPTTILEDATVPRSRIPDMVRGVSEIANKYNITIGNFGHAGDGNLHPTILTDQRDKEEFARVEKAIEEIFDLALSLGGTISGEHGIGSAKARFMPREVGRTGVSVMASIKKAMDPKGILNPGKMCV